MITCPQCGEENPDRFRFCGACGASLAVEGGPARETRKVVTVLFSDVAHSTALGEKLDPESLRRVMSRYFEEASQVLERHGGTVEKFIGDAVMAVFGVPVLHEDDALRAVRAASELHERLRALNEELERDFGVAIEIRTGLNTGEVVTGTEERLATGDAVNTAKRLEETAEPGEILLGATTFQLARDAVRAEAIDPVALKGKREEVRAFRLLELMPGAPAHARRLDSPIVGREREQERLRQAFEQAVDDRTCHLFTVLGAAGVGKSRLIEEFLSTIGGAATVVRGRCLPYGNGITFWPVGEVVRDAANVAESDSPARTRQHIAALLEGEENAELITERVIELIGIKEATGASEEGFWAVRRLFETLAGRHPLVVVFDDVHWAELTFLDLVDHVADWARDAPILLVCLARPDLLDIRPGWAGGKLNATSILLEPLPDGDCERLIENLLGQAELVAVARSRILEAAEGNPLFVEEMLEMLIDDGLLRRDNGGWVPTADLVDLSVPPSIQALLAARLDRLESAERAAVERASVEGKIFHRSAVAELSAGAGGAEIAASLQALVRKELIRPDRASFAGEDAFRFRHMLIRDAAYESMPKQARADLHDRLAAWLERMTGDRPAEYEEIVGYHLEQAFLYRSELGPIGEPEHALGRRAAQKLTSAGHKAAARGDMPAAANLFSRSLTLLPGDDRARAALVPDLAEAMIEKGDLIGAAAALETAMETLDALDERESSLRIHLRLLRWSVAITTDPEFDADRIREALPALIGTLEAERDELGLARAWMVQSEALNIAGRFGERQVALENAWEHARRAGAGRIGAGLAVPLCAVIAIGPTPVPEAIRRCEEVLAEAEGPTVEAAALMALAHCHAMLGRFDEARSLSARAVDIYWESGVRYLEGRTAQTTGRIEMLAGDFAAAERFLREGSETLRQLGETGRLSTQLWHLGDALYAQGRYDEAEQFSRESEQISALQDLDAQIGWRSVRAKVLARRGATVEAEALAREAVELAQRTDSFTSHGVSLIALAECLRLAGSAGEAAPVLREALEVYERKGDMVSAARIREQLDEVAP